MKEMKEFVQMRKWHVLAMMACAEFLAAGAVLLAARATTTSVYIAAGVAFIVIAVLGTAGLLWAQARDSELNERNGVKRFWLSWKKPFTPPAP